MRNDESKFPEGEANLPPRDGATLAIWSTQRFVKDDACETARATTRVLKLKLLGESKMGNTMRWTILPRLNIRASLPKSNLLEFHLREVMLLAPVDPLTGYQRAGS